MATNKLKTGITQDSHYVLGNDPKIAVTLHELRRSSAASPHTPKPRKGTRTARRNQAINDSLKG